MAGKSGAGGMERPKVSDEEIASMYGTSISEAKRVAALLGRDRADRRSDHRRATAEQELEAGKFDNIDDAVVLPTREQLRHGEFEPFTPDKTVGTIRSTQALRRVSEARIVQLHARGVLTDDTYPAVLWYRRAWEKTGYDTVLSASAMSERSAGGERAYGHMARTAVEAEARFAVHFAAGFIPADMLGTFDRVVLEEMTITDAARAARCRYANVTAVVRHAALLLLGGIAHLLPVRAVGAPGSSPQDVELARLRKVEALEAGAATDGEREAAGAAAERIRSRIDPVFMDDQGYLLPWDQISAIILAKLGDGVEDEAA
jgi:hypothetical protein